MTRPTTRAMRLLVAALPLSALPLFAGERFAPIGLAALVAVALLLAIDAALAPGARAWRIDVEAPDELHVGEEDSLAIEIEPLRSARVRDVELLVDLDEELLEPAAARTLPLGEAGPVRATLALVPRRRGEARIATAWLKWRGPLGLVERTLRHRLGLHVPVVPNVRAVRQAALRLSHASASWAGRKPERFLGDGSEFDSLRDYEPGFDPRTIDWKASARHRRLLARELRAERNHQLVLAIDCGQRMREPVDRLSRLDRAINAALMLAWVGLKHGDRVGLYAFDSRPRVYEPPRPGIAVFDRVRRRTAELAASVDATNYTLGLTHLAQRLERRALVVLFTDFADSIGAELLLENLGRLARRHVVLFVAVKDPEVERLALAKPAARRSLYRAVAAEDLLRERAEVLERISRLGVQPIDARADEVTTRLVNAYLDAKRRELVA